MLFNTHDISAHMFFWTNILSSQLIQHLQAQAAMVASKLTASMYDQADRSAMEAIAMRIVTVVTLFYLPATFSSVRNQVLPQTKPLAMLTKTLDLFQHRCCEVSRRSQILWSCFREIPPGDHPINVCHFSLCRWLVLVGMAKKKTELDGDETCEPRHFPSGWNYVG